MRLRTVCLGSAPRTPNGIVFQALRDIGVDRELVTKTLVADLARRLAEIGVLFPERTDVLVEVDLDDPPPPEQRWSHTYSPDRFR